MLENGAESPPSAARFVGRRFAKTLLFIHKTPITLY
jgi:hypothetical protein